MASFDIIETSGKAFMTAWEERRYLARLAMIPVAVKVISFALVLSFGFDNNIIRQNLFMLPAYLLEGWMLAHIVRLVFLGQRWPVQLTGESHLDAVVIADRARGIISGLIVYALIKMGQGALLAPVFYNQEALSGEQVEGDMSSLPLDVVFVGVAVLFALIWGFRLLWMYIPAAANLSMKRYLRAVSGMRSSFYMIGAWLICYIPFLMLSTLLINILMALSSGQQELMFFVSMMSHVAMDSIAMIVVTLGLSTSVRIMMFPEKKKS